MTEGSIEYPWTLEGHNTSPRSGAREQPKTMNGSLMIYGAYGYSGELIARRAVEKGLEPTLAGRDPDRVIALARELGLPFRVFKLEDPRIVEEELREMAAVLHCAGPFLHTHARVCRAAIATGTHYLDITGEAAVFESVAALGEQAAAAQVMLLPGVGFDVVPSDCLALHLKERLPDATSLCLAFKAMGKISRGTALTMVENIHRGGLVRQDGRLTPVPAAWKSRNLDFGEGGSSLAVTIPWGDVATAFHTTGIPNIEVYAAMPSSQRTTLRFMRYLAPLLGSTPVQWFMKGRVQARKPGPSAKQRARSKSYLWGEVTNPAGETAVTRLETPEGYTLTARTAVAIAERVLKGESPIGFQTPAKAFGADFITSIEGVGELIDEG